MTAPPAASEAPAAWPLLTPAQQAAVTAIWRAADAAGWPAYVVGGLPRDAVLGRPIGPDLDVVTVGDAVALAEAVRAAAGGLVVRHRRFLTATWSLAGTSVDLVTARRERYPAPGALPIVEPGTLDDDLARRDFTVNTLALPLRADGFGPLVDRHGALDDLAAGRVRVLHRASFADDPTRILRAVRTEARLGFRMDAATEALARAAVGGLAALTAARWRGELKRLFAEDDDVAVAALARLEDLGALAVLGPSPLRAAGTADVLTRLAARRRRLPGGLDRATARLMAWLTAHGPSGAAAGARLGLTARRAGDLSAAGALLADARVADATAAASAVYGAIAAARPSALALVLAAAAAADDVVRDRLDRYALDWAGRVPPADGHDLVALGVPPGPAVGAALAALRAAWWDGVVATRDDALAFARRWVTADADGGTVRGGGPVL